MMDQRVMYLVGAERVELRRDPIPRPGPGELVLRIRAATTCGTDVKVFRRGGHPRMLRVPTPFGHEMAGTVHAVGDGVLRFREGDRVVVANSAPCGECDDCLVSRENLCRDLAYLNGAFAEYLLVPARFVERNAWPVPPSLPFELAALTEPLACVLHGIEACDLTGPTDVAIWGAGPIGLLFVGVLAASGHRVVVADISSSRLEVARALGACDTVGAGEGGEPPTGARVRERSRAGEGFPLTIDATGSPRAWSEAILAVRKGGLVNLFGGCAPGTSIPLDTHHLHYGELRIQGVYHHRPATVARALEVLERGDFDAGRLLTREQPLEDLESALRAMIAGEVLKAVIRS